MLHRRSSSGVTAGKLWLPKPAFAEMRTQARRRAPEETGGMLLGWEADGQVVVHALIGPGPNARFARDRFEPDGHWQQGQLDAAYHASDRTVTYLGDWHSHPGGSPKPSSCDKNTAADVAHSRQARAPQPITLILYRRKRRWRPSAHRYCNGAFDPVEVVMYEHI